LDNERRRSAANPDLGATDAPMVSAVARARREPLADANMAEVDRALRCLHLLMRSTRLYERHHPHTLQSLDNAYEALRSVAVKLNGLELRVERGGIVAPNAGDLISEVALAIEMGAEAADIGLTIHPHPTLSESVGMAAEVYEGTVTDLYLPKKK